MYITHINNITSSWKHAYVGRCTFDVVIVNMGSVWGQAAKDKVTSIICALSKREIETLLRAK